MGYFQTIFSSPVNFQPGPYVSKINGFSPYFKFRSFWVKKLPRNSINNGFNRLWLIFLSSVAGVIEVLNSSFYIISHRVSFRKWVNVGNIVSFHCSLLKQVNIIVSTVLKNFMPSALLLDIQELMSQALDWAVTSCNEDSSSFGRHLST